MLSKTRICFSFGRTTRRNQCLLWPGLQGTRTMSCSIKGAFPFKYSCTEPLLNPFSNDSHPKNSICTSWHSLDCNQLKVSFNDKVCEVIVLILCFLPIQTLQVIVINDAVSFKGDSSIQHAAQMWLFVIQKITGCFIVEPLSCSFIDSIMHTHVW